MGKKKIGEKKQTKKNLFRQTQFPKSTKKKKKKKKIKALKN